MIAPDLIAPLNVAVLQMNSGSDKDANVGTALDLIDRAAGSGARLVVLPEVWTYLGPDEGNRPNADSVPGPVTELLADRARRHGIYVHGGSFLETRRDDPGLYNRIGAATKWPVEVDFSDADGNKTSGRVLARIIR